MAVIGGIVLMVGAFAGSRDPLRPHAGIAGVPAQGRMLEPALLR